MNEQALRGLIAEVKVGKASRRAFVQRMVALGLTAPMASQMLNHCCVAQAQTKFEYKPTKRGGGGALKILWWQGATLLNPHFAVGTKDQEAHESSTSHSPHGILVESSWQISLPRSQAAKTAASLPTACL